jgi:hypothetical protein
MAQSKLSFFLKKERGQVEEKQGMHECGVRIVIPHLAALRSE